MPPKRSSRQSNTRRRQTSTLGFTVEIAIILHSGGGAVAMCVGICWRGLRWDEDTGSGSQVNRLFSKVLV